MTICVPSDIGSYTAPRFQPQMIMRSNHDDLYNHVYNYLFILTSAALCSDVGSYTGFITASYTCIILFPIPASCFRYQHPVSDTSILFPILASCFQYQHPVFYINVFMSPIP